ncbi:MAG: hypothetical protein ACKO0W_07755, partial [Planctomycetota bacterium]
AAPLADVVFVVLPGESDCAAEDLVILDAVGTAGSQFSTAIGTILPATGSDMPSVRLDGEGPAFAGLPASGSRATDAGSLFGAFIAQPNVTASDECSGVSSVTVSIANPDGSTSTSWPADGMFAIGASTVTWSSADDLGNTASESRTFTVEPYQLLDAAVVFEGSMAGTSQRTIRVTIGGTTLVRTVTFTGNTGAITGIEVPVATGYPCLLARDPAHSITDASGAVVSAARYAAAFSLKQGDSNSDDMVDILDFGVFIQYRGQASAPNGPSNFNADGVVNNADFAYVSINFTKVGETCGSATGATPRTRVSVRELRRAGLGHLAQADLNGDGWVDSRDIWLSMQNGGAPTQEELSEAAGVAP